MASVARYFVFGGSAATLYPVLLAIFCNYSKIQVLARNGRRE